MSNEGKKLLFILSGALGVAIIVILTALVLKLVLQTNTPVQPVPVIEQAAVQPPAPPAPPVATVVNVQPHYTSVSVPKRQCHDVQRTVYVAQESRTPNAGALIGGVTGGILGSQIGGGTGKIVTGAAGAAIGALTGNSIQHNMNAPQARTVYGTACSTQYVKSTVQKGYEVTYTYNGNQGVMIMKDAPVVGSVLPFPAA